MLTRPHFAAQMSEPGRSEPTGRALRNSPVQWRLRWTSTESSIRRCLTSCSSSRPVIDDALRPPVLTLSAGSTTPTSASFRRWATFTRRPEDVFRPLFEALSWAVVLGKVGRSGRASREERAVIRGLGEDLLALELARNRSQHQWLSAL